MKWVNPALVYTPDDRVGVLVGRHGLNGYIERPGQRRYESFALAALRFHMEIPPAPDVAPDAAGRPRRKRQKNLTR